MDAMIPILTALSPEVWAWGLALGLIASAWCGATVRLAQLNRTVPTLEAEDAGRSPPGGDTWPRVSVIVPARNEAPHIAEALSTLLEQDYPDLEVIAVNDRSDDATGELLDRIASEWDSAAGNTVRLTVRHLTELPAGWLGKTHAMHVGASVAQGQWLLFTDSDIKFSPDAVRAVMGFALRHEVGHVVATPKLESKGFWERVLLAAFALAFALKFQVWALRKAGTRAYVGAGTFSLVRSEDYRRVGGHTRLALTVVDDLRLGLLLRRSGVPQALVSAPDRLSVRWHPGLWATLRGMIKNAFAEQDYRWGTTMGSVGLLIGLSVLPWAGLFLAPHEGLRWLASIGLGLPMLLHGITARRSLGGSGLEGVGFSVAYIGLAGVMLASAGVTTVRGGLVWRDTQYPLDTLRAGNLKERDLPSSGSVGW